MNMTDEYFDTIWIAMAPDATQGERAFGREALRRLVVSPVNPDATQALVTALRAIVDRDTRYGLHGHHFLTLEEQDAAKNALHMAQLPVAPVSEDVETIGTAIGELECPMCSYSHPMQRDALAALDRLAAAAGRHSDR